MKTLKIDKPIVTKLLGTNNIYLDFNAYNRIRVYKPANYNIFDKFVIVITPSIYDNGKGLNDIISTWTIKGAELEYKHSKHKNNYYIECNYKFNTLEKFTNKVKTYQINQ